MVKPEAFMPQALLALKQYTGIPVVDSEGQCVGVLSDRVSKVQVHRNLRCPRDESIVR